MRVDELPTVATEELARPDWASAGFRFLGRPAIRSGAVGATERELWFALWFFAAVGAASVVMGTVGALFMESSSLPADLAGGFLLVCPIGVGISLAAIGICAWFLQQRRIWNVTAARGPDGVLLQRHRASVAAGPCVCVLRSRVATRAEPAMSGGGRRVHLLCLDLDGGRSVVLGSWRSAEPELSILKGAGEVLGVPSRADVLDAANPAAR